MFTSLVPRALRWGALAAAPAALLLAAAAPADAPAPRPVVTLAAQVSAQHRPIVPGAPLKLTLHAAFSSTPPGGDLVLQRDVFLFGRGARYNGALFPSCSVARILAAHGRLSACPPGSKVGAGVATGRAVAVGVTSSGRVTLFNGPGGRSVTINVVVVHPALIEATYSASIRRVRVGRWTYALAERLPPELQTVLDGDIVITRLDVTAGATRVIGGRPRGYFEAASCPRHGGAPLRGEFFYRGGAIATVDTSVRC
jgi:hypothetical protein